MFYHYVSEMFEKGLKTSFYQNTGLRNDFGTVDHKNPKSFIDHFRI